ncbi:SCO5389 family protein [Actinomadura xylanilytica]|uniref:SCO5389 family protein n=1 Tax=Actinomadura xylanilytica TaxID=887459 RepID=UPI00255B0419|nr:SCO5389 family protein [Actinomadura xylanilytica]MDL4775974.1 SCO5389 family protein [Actinomadura xylanilytica]
MSLTVSPELLKKAQNGKVGHDEFIACIAESLPYAWGMVTRLVGELKDGGEEGVQNLTVPETEEQWGQMFRMFSSDSMRNAIQRHFGVRLAFQNCCKPGVFRPDAKDAYEAFVSPEAQLLNQDPTLVNC